jgi:raffinose/stachyose/melibiose transport system permease protein
MPFVISVVLSSFIWSYIYSDVLYAFFGIPSPLGRPDWVMMGIVVICAWRDSGYCMIIYVAALQTIPKDYYEVGLLEGISPWQKFSMITLPLIGPAVTANLTLTLSWG